jgi:phenylpyruvate tautomerase PptA (4-oxalocrotonate tautomerase family)
MPLLQISTNISIDDPGTIASEASKLVASMLGKPESYVMVIVNTDQTLIFAGDNDGAAHMKLKSLGLPESETASYSKQLCGFMEQKLGISPGRIYIEFDGPPRHMWGWDNRTF